MDQMKRRLLGNTNLKIAPLGLGTVKFGRNTDVKYPAHFELPSDEQIRSLLELARRLGINFIDTAPAYGSSEKRIGKLLPSPRSDWVISTKVGETYQNQQSVFDFTPRSLQQSIKQSLTNLNLNEIDLVLIHSDGRDESITKFGPAFETLQNLKTQGIIRAFGISPKTLQGAQLGIEHTDAVMLTLNQHDATMLSAIQLAHKKNVGIIIKKGFASGHFQKGETSEQPATAIENALRFIFQFPGITTVVVGTINPDHLESNIADLKKILTPTRRFEP